MIYDLQERGIVFCSKIYEDARCWLSEDDYEPIFDRIAVQR